MRRLALLVTLAVFCSVPGVAASAGGPREWLEPSTPEQQAALAGSPDYQRFLQAAGGQWRSSFDPVLMTPRAIYGSGLPLVSAGADQRRVEMAALKFLDDNASLFGARRGEYVINSATFGRDLWIVSAGQRFNGIPVEGASLSMAIKHGRLILVQGVAHRVWGVDGFARISKEEAVGKAHRGLGVGPRRTGKAKDSDVARQIILPMRSPGAVNYRLAWEVRSRRQGEGLGLSQHVVSYVDAQNGDVLGSYDGNRYEYSVNAGVQVEDRTVDGPLVTTAAPFLKFTFAGAAAQTNAAGLFTFNGLINGPQQVSAQLHNAFVRVLNDAGPEANFNGTANENTPFSLLFDSTNSDPAERMTFAAVTQTNRFVAPVFPSLAFLNTVMPAVVNLNDQCNAFTDGTGIYMFGAGSVCNATGRIFDIVAHEWGHVLDVNAPGGFEDGALSEFIGDLVAFTQTDDPRIGPGFFKGSSAGVRNLNEGAQCFDSSTTGVHDAGLQLGAVVWDIREDLKASGVSADELRRLMLEPVAIGQRRSEWYLAMLAADDDDGNLANGTPHECLIYRQFELHSCDGERWIGLPPASNVSASPSVLWPANHQMVPVSIDVVAANSCSAQSCRVASVHSNEPVDGLGDGDTGPDWVINGQTLMLRAERSGKGSGRVYTVRLECTDAAGNASTTSVAVTVPRDRR
jgi:Zn-dependent metalloprotease